MPTKSKTAKTASKKSHSKGTTRRWSAEVTATSDATHPPEGLFKKDALHDRAHPGVEEGLAQRARVRHAHA